MGGGILGRWMHKCRAFHPLCTYIGSASMALVGCTYFLQNIGDWQNFAVKMSEIYLQQVMRLRIDLTAKTSHCKKFSCKLFSAWRFPNPRKCSDTFTSDTFFTNCTTVHILGKYKPNGTYQLCAFPSHPIWSVNVWRCSVVRAIVLRWCYGCDLWGVGCAIGNDSEMSHYSAFLIALLFFGRSVIWLQRRRDEVMERLRGGSLRKEEQYEYHIGRLRQDRVHIPRTEGQVKAMYPVFFLTG